MKVIITSKNFNASDHLKETIETKMEKLGKYFSKEIVANVTLVMEKGRQKIEATINAKGTIFRAEELTSDAYDGVDRVVEKLSSQMSRFKTKLVRKHNDHKEFYFENMPEATFAETEEMAVVRKKKFDVVPMTVDEAIMQMELVGHSFYIFLNVETDTISVVYKRKDESYGLLEPQY